MISLEDDDCTSPAPAAPNNDCGQQPQIAEPSQPQQQYGQPGQAPQLQYGQPGQAPQLQYGQPGQAPQLQYGAAGAQGTVSQLVPYNPWGQSSQQLGMMPSRLGQQQIPQGPIFGQQQFVPRQAAQYGQWMSQMQYQRQTLPPQAFSQFYNQQQQVYGMPQYSQLQTAQQTYGQPCQNLSSLQQPQQRSAPAVPTAPEQAQEQQGGARTPRASVTKEESPVETLESAEKREDSVKAPEIPKLEKKKEFVPTLEERLTNPAVQLSRIERKSIISRGFRGSKAPTVARKRRREM